MWYVFHGDDELSRSEAILELKQRMDPIVGPLNTAQLDGRSLSVSDLRGACDAVPFMGGTRLVIVNGLRAAAEGEEKPRRKRGEARADDAFWQALEGYLPWLPQSTELVFNVAEALPGGHPLLRLAASCGGQVRAFAVPVGAELEHWIRRRAEAKGASIAPDAAELLATYVGANLRLLDQELEKLATYVGPAGTIGRREVERLVSAVQEANIFHMVDALGNRDGRRALQLLRRLLQEGKAPLLLLTMITRQFRLLLQARELDAQRVPVAEMARQMEVKPFVAKKCLEQAMHFRPGDLRAILAELLDIDVGIKTGQLDGPLALDLFVTRWTERRHA